MKSLSILFNTYPIAFGCPGGGEVQLLKYIEALESLGVTCLRYDPWNPVPQFITADIVHFFSVQGGSWPFCNYVRNVRKLPLIISPIIWIDDPAKYGMGEIEALLRMSDHILPNSQAECDQLASLFNIAPSFFSPIVNGVDEIFFTQTSFSIFREHFDIQAPFVLCMGNIEARKNQLRLIEALKGTGIHLVLAGQEREADYAEQCHALSDSNVHFVGILEHGSELQRSAYAAAEALVLPSTLETPGLAALEAAAAGCRIAVTQEGCTREYFKDFAEYLDPCDTTSIRDAVQAAMHAPRRPEFSTFVKEHYMWKHAANQLIVVYHNLLAARNNREI